MARPKLKQEEKKVRINITLDKSVYKNLQQKGVKLFPAINKLLKVAYFNDSKLLKESFAEEKCSPTRTLKFSGRFSLKDI